MSKKKEGLGYLNTVVLVIIGVIVAIYSFVSKTLLKSPLKKFKNNILMPLVDTIDNQETGVIVFLVFLIEFILLLIVPWFFSWKVGLIIFIHASLTVSSFLLLIETDAKIKQWNVITIITLAIPYLFLALFPTIALTIIREKPEKRLTIIEKRKKKLKYIKKKIIINKLKFWKK